MKISIVATVVLLICAALPELLPAQPATAIDRFERSQREAPFRPPSQLNLSTNREAPELYPGENTDVGLQRILRLKPRKTYFEALADSQYFYTDNAFLSDQNKNITALFVNTIQAAFAPEPYRMAKGQFAPQLGYRSQWFNYDLDGHDDGLNFLDFNAQTVFLAGHYQLGLWQFSAGFDFTRLLDQSRYEEAYREYVPNFAIQRFFPVDDKLTIVIGGQFNYHFSEVNPLAQIQTNLVSKTNTRVNDRYDFSAGISLSYEVIPQLVLQPFYRMQYTHYSGFSDNPLVARSSRVDFVHTVGASVAYYFNKNVSARVFASYERKDSDYSATYDYHKLDAGGGLSFDFRF